MASRTVPGMGTIKEEKHKACQARGIWGRGLAQHVRYARGRINRRGREWELQSEWRCGNWMGRRWEAAKGGCNKDVADPGNRREWSTMTNGSAGFPAKEMGGGNRMGQQ